MAQVLLGFLYEHGLGVVSSPDHESAIEWYTRAATAEFAPGQCALALLLRQKQDETAFALLNQAARAGYAPAQFYLGCSYQFATFTVGQGQKIPEPNFDLALDWLEKSADQGFTPTMVNLYRMYRKGEFGVEEDNHLAMAYLNRAAMKGDPDAAFFLGSELLGLGGKKQMTEGLHWIHKAAVKGHVEAHMKLANIYASGQHGVRKNSNLSEYFRNRVKSLPENIYRPK